MPDIYWGYWRDYQKTVSNGRTYALVGNRFYSKHAVDYFLPSGRRSATRFKPAAGEGGGSLTNGRSIPPTFVEEAILHGTTRPDSKHPQRIVHMLGDLEVVTEEDGMIVVTISYRHD